MWADCSKKIIVMIVNDLIWSSIYRNRKKVLTLFAFLNSLLFILVEKKNQHQGNIGNDLRRSLEEMVQRNNYEPVPGAGEDGEPVNLPVELKKMANLLKEYYSYSILASDRVSIHRRLPDMRNDVCKFVDYDREKLPSASVIVIFHNEAWSVIMRTVVSIIDRTPEKLLREIILVDDFSNRKCLGDELVAAVARYPKVRILRSKARIGLVGARLMGARDAKADVLVFLDAHCEVTIGWLEPLLDRAGSTDAFVSSHIDTISEDTLEYWKTKQQVGAFSWRLKFIWIYPDDDVLFLQSDNPASPFPTPVMSGGLFAVRKDLFWKLGGYDERMRFWGAENIELSLRAWQCGAKVEIAPCSIVGHVFKEGNAVSNYDIIKQKDIYTNWARTALVWMDEYADFYFKLYPYRKVDMHTMNVSERVELRKTLKCKSFKWYLDNVWPTNFLPSKEKWFGKIRNARGACLGPNLRPTEPARAVDCNSSGTLWNMYLVFSADGKIMSEEGLCLEVGKNRAVVWNECKDTYKQIWVYSGSKIKDKHFHHKSCLMLVGNDKSNGIGDPLKMRMCTKKKGQIWNLEKVSW